MNYIYIVLGHVILPTGKMAIVEVPDDYTFMSTYKQVAKEKACLEFGLNKEDTWILDYKFLGTDLTFINA